MLRELHISNLAVIEDATIELGEGLNCFTGQTGAGKSLVIGAFELLLGQRSAGDLLRSGTEEGRVSGVFELTDPPLIKKLNDLADLGLDPQATPEQLLITRKLFSSGRTSVSINGQPATLTMLQTIGEYLVDVHGQHDHQYLLKPGNQLYMLDRFGECEAMRDAFAETAAQLRELRQRKKELQTSADLRRQQLDLYEFQAAEIDEAEPTDGEFDELDARFRVLKNLAKIQQDAGHAHAALYEADGSVAERLQAIVGVLRELAEIDEDLRGIAEEVKTSLATLQDASFALGRYLNRLDLDAGELGEIESRLNILNRLIQKYSEGSARLGGSLEDVLAYREKIDEEIKRLRSESSNLNEIDQQITPLAKRLEELGQALSEARQKAVKKLIPLVEDQLVELGMSEARLDAQFEKLSPSEISESGFDRFELLIQPNPGQEAKPLRRIASGGELSRIMLALKSILASSDRISVLVFDEVDANIGGRMGSVIGEKLRDLASHHQVLCITHLPQIAAYAPHHLRVAKEVIDGQTCTTVKPLKDEQRIDELAEMLTGKDATATTRKQAQELMGRAAERRLADTGKKRGK